VTREGQLVIIDISANAFLHHMVRNIAGVLISIGKSEHPPEWANEVLQRKDRACAAVTAPPGGLYFMSVQYDPQHGI
jgi:tRNA pseudouridine38-40 synthase